MFGKAYILSVCHGAGSESVTEVNCIDDLPTCEDQLFHTELGTSQFVEISEVEIVKTKISK